MWKGLPLAKEPNHKFLSQALSRWQLFFRSWIYMASSPKAKPWKRSQMFYALQRCQIPQFSMSMWCSWAMATNLNKVKKKVACLVTKTQPHCCSPSQGSTDKGENQETRCLTATPSHSLLQCRDKGRHIWGRLWHCWWRGWDFCWDWCVRRPLTCPPPCNDLELWPTAKGRHTDRERVPELCLLDLFMSLTVSPFPCSYWTSRFINLHNSQSMLIWSLIESTYQQLSVNTFKFDRAMAKKHSENQLQSSCEQKLFKTYHSKC